nr:excalibur calcium-binding domain-containing protein [Fusobacteriaceae bacterium]
MTKFIIIASICLVSIATNSAEKQSTKQITFANCTEARAAGYEDIKKGEPGYAPKL